MNVWRLLRAMTKLNINEQTEKYMHVLLIMAMLPCKLLLIVNVDVNVNRGFI